MEKKRKEKMEKKRKEKMENKEKGNKENMINKKSEKGVKRVFKEYYSIVNDRSMGADIIMIDNDSTKYKIRFTPKDGHYKDQTMIIMLNTKHPSHSYSYPFAQPLVKMLTPVWHVNVSNSGAICVDFLTNTDKWNPSYGFGAIIIAIQLLFEEPNPLSPYNAQAAKLFRESKAQKDFTKFDFTTKKIYDSKIKSGGYKILNDFNKEYKLQHNNRVCAGL